MKKIAKEMINAYKLLNVYKRYVSFRNESKPTKPCIEGDKIVILGNGPSQKLFWENRSKFDGYKILCMNEFPYYDRERFLEIRPDYYCAIDPIATDADKAEAYGHEYPTIFREKQNLFNNYVSWDMGYITWSTNSNCYDNENIRKIGISKISCEGIKLSDRIKLFEKNIATVNAESVGELAVFFAILFGFKEIALFGIDLEFSVSINEDNDLLGITPHSYSQNPAECPIRDGKGEHWIYELYEGVATVHREFVVLRKYADYKNITVINYNPRSFVDAFEKRLLSDE